MQAIYNKQQFESALTSSKLVCALFGRTSCSDCTFLLTFMPKIVSKYSNIDFIFLDTKAPETNQDDFKELFEKYKIIGVPSFVCFNNQKVVSSFISTLRKSEQQVLGYLEETITKV